MKRDTYLRVSVMMMIESDIFVVYAIDDGDDAIVLAYSSATTSNN